VDAFALIEAGWGKDAVVCVFSRRELGELLEHLRKILRGPEPAAGDPNKGKLVGFCWPSVVAHVLADQPAETVSGMLAGIDAVLVESAPPHAWRVYSGSGFGKALAKLGFEEVSED
jgi:hypothetical protein